MKYWEKQQSEITDFVDQKTGYWVKGDKQNDEFKSSLKLKAK